MDWTDVGEKVKQFAPMLGKALALSAPLTGPVGPLAGGLISAVAGAFGVDPDEAASDPAKLLGAITADPEAQVKLAEIESNERLELRRILLRQEQLRIGDVASARTRQTETEKATGRKDRDLYALAWLVVAGFFILIGVLMFVEVKENPAVIMLFGALSSGFGAVMQYFFGSSKSSAQKTELIARGASK